MARFKNEAADHKPGLAFNLRKEAEGGKLRDPLEQIPVNEAHIRTSVVILVHGFNNHLGTARTYYRTFRDRQYELDEKLMPKNLESLIADLHWPGDADWGIADKLDFLIYPAAVGTAQKTKAIIASHLRSMQHLHKVSFIGHSLGCRVVLETIDELSKAPGPSIEKVCLMAAAVPVFKVVEGGQLYDAISRPKKVLVMHSRSDKVLKWAFRLGQSAAAGDEGLWPRALGSRKPPSKLPANVDEINIKGAGHSDYWGDPVANTCPLIKNFFGIGRPRRSVGSEHAIASLLSPDQRPDSAPPRSIESRSGASVRLV